MMAHTMSCYTSVTPGWRSKAKSVCQCLKFFVEIGIYKVSGVESNMVEWTVVAFFTPS